MTQINILSQLKELVLLQEVDVQIYELKKTLKEKPEFLSSLEQGFENKKQILKELEEKSKVVLLKRKGQEGDLKAKDDLIAKANSQLSQIKTNKEYTAKLTEIENIKADKAIIEEQILLSYDESDKLKEEIEKEKKVVAEKEQGYLAQKKEIEGTIKAIEKNVKELEAKRLQTLPNVDRALLSRYERILASREGIAIVPVEKQVCGGCFMNVPPQVINEIKKHDELIFCEMCSRIIFLKEDLNG